VARVKVACLEGLEFAGKMFEVRQMDVEGLSEEEIKVMEVQKKEAESKRREEASKEKKGARPASGLIRQGGSRGQGSSRPLHFKLNSDKHKKDFAKHV
jgi:hypothetical protein